MIALRMEDCGDGARIKSILASGPRAIRLQKALIREWEELPASEGIARGVACFVRAWETDEPRRMMSAFLERMRQRQR